MEEFGAARHGRDLPIGEGLFAFSTMDEIVDAVDRIESDYAGHCHAARELAAEYFSAEKVIESMLERAAVPSAVGRA